MAVVHNMIIRALNSIYLQAPHVQQKDVKDFLAYCYCWYECIDGTSDMMRYPVFITWLTKLAHHRGEEEFLFPKLEAACGEKGLMDANVKQHRKAHLFPQ